MSGVDARYLGLTANQLAKIATDLKAENAKFIVKLNAEHIARQNVEVENDKLRDENAELQKLGGFMLRCMSRYHDCADCLVNGEHCEISHIEADALELGIEVPS